MAKSDKALPFDLAQEGPTDRADQDSVYRTLPVAPHLCSPETHCSRWRW